MVNTGNKNSRSEACEVHFSPYFQRKFHIQYTLPDGNIFHGMINTEAYTKEELYSQEEIKGSFWAEKIEEGWLGEFRLNDGLSYCKLDDNHYVKTLPPYVVVNGVFRPKRKFDTISSREEAEELLRHLNPVKYKTLERFEGRLEDCIVSCETHFWD